MEPRKKRSIEEKRERKAFFRARQLELNKKQIERTKKQIAYENQIEQKNKLLEDCWQLILGNHQDAYYLIRQYSLKDIFASINWEPPDINYDECECAEEYECNCFDSQIIEYENKIADRLNHLDIPFYSNKYGFVPDFKSSRAKQFPKNSFAKKGNSFFSIV